MSVRVGYARWRQAEAVLEHGGTAAEATPLLRAASESAVGAVPLAEAIDALAQRARIRLDPAPVITQAKPPMRESGYGLTDRELLVLQLITTGRTNKQIGAELFMSPKTASVHVTNILRKLGVKNRVEAAMLAERAGLVGRV
jgi:DNA-binding NarL/FixJ family response regulator